MKHLMSYSWEKIRCKSQSCIQDNQQRRTPILLRSYDEIFISSWRLVKLWWGSHMVHEYGRSPVCTRRWSYSWQTKFKNYAYGIAAHLHFKLTVRFLFIRKSSSFRRDRSGITFSLYLWLQRYSQLWHLKVPPSICVLMWSSNWLRFSIGISQILQFFGSSISALEWPCKCLCWAATKERFYIIV